MVLRSRGGKAVTFTNTAKNNYASIESLIFGITEINSDTFDAL